MHAILARRCLEAATHATGLTADTHLGGPAASAPVLRPNATPSRMDSDNDSPAASREPSPTRGPGARSSLSQQQLGWRGGAREGGPAVVHGEEQRLTGHSGTVMALVVSDTGLLFSGSTDNTIRVG